MMILLYWCVLPMAVFFNFAFWGSVLSIDECSGAGIFRRFPNTKLFHQSMHGCNISLTGKFGVFFAVVNHSVGHSIVKLAIFKTNKNILIFSHDLTQIFKAILKPFFLCDFSRENFSIHHFIWFGDFGVHNSIMF